MELTPIVELGVAEAYEILIRHFGVTGLPPLEAIENEDWGRDYVLSRLYDMPAQALAAAGLVADGETSACSGQASGHLDPITPSSDA
jgi:hypothetical protein